MAYPDSEDLDGKKEDDVLERAKAWFKDCRPIRSKWAEQAKECYDFVAGNQWDDEDREKLRKEMRPCITYNQLFSLVNSVTGSEVSNRQEVRYIPRSEGDSGVNAVLTSAAEWVRDECDAADEESDAFGDLTIGGMGWTETRLDYETNPDGKVLVERVDPFEMWWDCKSKRRNLDDARYVMRVKDIPRDEAKDMFPDAEEDDLDANWAKEFGEDQPTEIHDATQAPWYKNDNPRRDDKLAIVRLVECQWWERKKIWRVADPTTGKIASFDEDQYETIKDRTEKLGMPIEGVEQSIREYRKAVIGNKVLWEGKNLCDKSFTYRCMTGYRDRNNSQWYGLVKMALDPQRWANKWLSQSLHILNTNAKGGPIIEKGAVENIQEFEKSWADPSKITYLTNGAISGNRFTQRQMPGMPSGFEKLMEFSFNSIRTITGVSAEFQGTADRQQAGVLEYQRKQAALNVLATLFDGLKRYRKEQGRLLLHIISKYISDGRLIRIVGDEGAKYVPLVKQDETIEYDVIVDDAPDAPNMKERVWSVLQSMMPVLQSLAVPIPVWVEILKFSPLPETLTDKLAQILQQVSQGGLPPEIQKTLEDMGKTIEKLQQENMQLKDKKAETQAELQISAQKTQAEIQLERQKLEAELAMEWKKLQAQLEIEATKLQNETAIKGAQLQQEQEVGQIKIAQEKQKHDANLEMMDAKSRALKGKTPKGKPSRKRVKVNRGEDGAIAGFEVEDE